MILNTEIGKIYDTIYFCIEYFNKAEIEKPIKSFYADTGFMFECYDEVSAKVGNLPLIIAPFFYYRDQIPTAISCFFMKNVDFHHTLFDDFIESIINNSQALYHMTFDALFTSNQKAITSTENAALYIEAIDRLEMPLEFKLQVSLLFGNFDYGISVLKDTLKTVYSYVDELHQKFGPKIMQEYANIQNNNKARLYHQFSKLEDSAELDVVSVSLLNQYIVYQRIYGDKVSFLLGFKHDNSLSDNPDESQTSAENFLIACGNETRIEIIKVIIKNGELTASQIAKLIDCPITTLIRHIEILRSNNVISISKRSGLQIFYRLNISYFKQARGNMERFFYRIISQK